VEIANTAVQSGYATIISIVNVQPTSNVKSKLEEAGTINEWPIGAEKYLERCL